MRQLPSQWLILKIIHCKWLITTEETKSKFSHSYPQNVSRYVQKNTIQNYIYTKYRIYCGIQTPSFHCPKSFGIKGRIPLHYFLASSICFFSFISRSLFLKASRSFLWRRQKCNFHHRFFSLPKCTIMTFIAATNLPVLQLEVERSCSVENVARKQLVSEVI